MDPKLQEALYHAFPVITDIICGNGSHLFKDNWENYIRTTYFDKNPGWDLDTATNPPHRITPFLVLQSYSDGISLHLPPQARRLAEDWGEEVAISVENAHRQQNNNNRMGFWRRMGASKVIHELLQLVIVRFYLGLEPEHDGHLVELVFSGSVQRRYTDHEKVLALCSGLLIENLFTGMGSHRSKPSQDIHNYSTLDGDNIHHLLPHDAHFSVAFESPAPVWESRAEGQLSDQCELWLTTNHTTIYRPDPRFYRIGGEALAPEQTSALVEGPGNPARPRPKAIKRVRLISPRLSPKRRRDDGDELKTDKTDRESESTRSLDEHSTPPKKNPRRSLEPKRTKRTRLESSDEESEFQPSQDHLELSRRSLDLREKGPQVTRELRSSRKVIVPTAHPNKRRKGVRS